MLVQNFESLQTRKRYTRGGAEHWKESYIPGFGVSIGVKDRAINVKGNPSQVLLGFDLPSPRLRGFLKSSLS